MFKRLPNSMRRRYKGLLNAAFLLLVLCGVAFGQTTAAAKVGSETAKGGFRNEDVIRDKFNAYKTDEDAKAWLREMNYDPAKIVSLTAAKPHGEKADVEVTIQTSAGTKREGISIKLVSSDQGFNQIDKCWLAHYAKMWAMPADVVTALKLFVGETPPTKSGRSMDRMFLNEIDPKLKDAVVKFFSENKAAIVSDLFAGDGEHSAGWVMVAFKPGERTEWIIRSSKRTIEFYGEGDVMLTRGGNLKIGRITMQRKGGDAGRDTAKMLQFKINPVELFNAK
ncbi:MAG: type II restriction endonuclease [Acidobacteria bacterium]|nr:type II restriction endonuclease [Acidobacteriota bacterium]